MSQSKPEWNGSYEYLARQTRKITSDPKMLKYFSYNPEYYDKKIAELTAEVEILKERKKQHAANQEALYDHFNRK